MPEITRWTQLPHQFKLPQHLSTINNMRTPLTIITIIFVAIVAILYQLVFKSLLFESLGYGRSVFNISAFEVKCEKLIDPDLEACEDMWLHESTGLLYLSCSDSQHRPNLVPGYVSFLPQRALLVTCLLIALADLVGSTSLDGPCWTISPSSIHEVMSR